MLLSLLQEKSVMVVSQVPRDGLHPSVQWSRWKVSG